MFVEFFLDHAKFEFSTESLTYTGYVPDLPEVYAEAVTLEECRAKLGRAVGELLAREASGKRTEEATSAARLSDPHPEREQPEPRRAGPFSEIIYQKHDWIAQVTINRPELYNVYSSTTLREMTEAFRDAAADEHVAVLVLTGAGDQAFCTGSDLNEHSEEHLGRPQKYWEWMGLLIEAHDALRQLGKPSVARINGIVAGGGNEWNLACDLAIAAENTRFMQVETTVGMVAASGATQWLPLLIGDRRAREMLMTCEPVTAERALQWGLVNEVVPFAELDSAVDNLCRKLVNKFPDCTRYTRQQLNFWKNYVWDATIERARAWLSLHFAGPEAAEGINALGEHRDIDYRSVRTLGRANGSAESKPSLGPDGKKLKSCPWCGGRGIPESFDYCGFCGGRMK